jgi:hypothetical protein
MNHDAMNDSDRFSDDRSSSSSEKEEGRKPFVEPELRRETGLVDGTGTTVSGMNVDD